ncbi:MAG: 7-cyano-7-deazaguanine synthase [Candidatus Nanoarchaeia archaeon]|nr:7-cyano-7-deazaguanine synthase [Candidatus Nanoarchaeia archaeon]MDD5741428.1 7-cyano-7-deazaguanine synthase [Candidatus Nanoarchaeia archaeon]
MNNAIILCSGGLDSIVLAHYLKKIEKIENLKLIFLDYGQKSLKEELSCVKKASEELESELKIINLRWLGEISTSLINKQTNEKEIKNIKNENELISWYVPCRNALFLLIGLAIAESEFISKNEKYDVYLGIKHEGELQFKDTTPEFLKQMNKTIEFCTQDWNYKFIAPFLKKDKEEVIEIAKKLNINLQDTYSCYIGKGFKNNLPVHCGICGGCKSRKKAFKFSNITDPSVYEN